MLGRYPDAIRAFSHILFFVLRLKHFQRGSQFDQINKTADRMYALLAICQALCPTKVDEGIATAMKDKFGEQYGKMARGGEESVPAFQELFLHGAPRFISPNPPPYEAESDDVLAQFTALPDSSAHQLSIFLAAVEPQLSTSTLRSFLRLYTTLGTDKLAKFLDVEEEKVLEMLMTAKGAARKTTWSQGSLLEGEEVGVSDINFGIDEVRLFLLLFSPLPSLLTLFIRNRVTSPSPNRPPLAATATSSPATASSSPPSPRRSRTSPSPFPSLKRRGLLELVRRRLRRSRGSRSRHEWAVRASC
jgi:hypothetical protein